MARWHGTVLVAALTVFLVAASPPPAPGTAEPAAPLGRVAPAQADPVACSLTGDLADGMLRIRASATAGAPTRVRYTLAIAKAGAAGTARSLQSGEASLAAGEAQGLASVAVEANAAGHLSALLALETPAGRVTCAYP